MTKTQARTYRLLCTVALGFLALGLLGSCGALGITRSPVVVQIDFDGQGTFVIDGQNAVMLGDATGLASVRLSSSVIPLYSLPWDQQGDYMVLSDLFTNPQGHHHAYGATHVIPKTMAHLFTPTLLEEYPRLEIATE